MDFLHKILSSETIKPSSPTPSHLHTYNLSLLDQLAPPACMPIVLFYPNNQNLNTSTTITDDLKKSLSQTLTKYYPFAGRFPIPRKAFVDCNDEGVALLEARNDGEMESFLYNMEHTGTIVDRQEMLQKLFPEGQLWRQSTEIASLIAIQLNTFACGGVAVAVSMSHKIADASTLDAFMNHWAMVTRHGSLDHEDVLNINPSFFLSPTAAIVLPEAPVNHGDNCITKKFVFSNAKLADLKNKVIAMEPAGAIKNPTRVEVLSSLLYKTAVAAATANAGSFTPSALCMPVDMRRKLVERLPETTVGNIISVLMIWGPKRNELITLNGVVAELKKGKMQFEGVKNVQEIGERLMAMMVKTMGESGDEVKNVDSKNVYFSSCLCGIPFNKVDFGFGKPTRVILPADPTLKSYFLMTDAMDGDGIEVDVTLVKEDMGVFENDKELLEFCSKI